MVKKILIAHRGESHIAPENSLSSINLAWENDDDVVEIDVRLTKDKQVVVFHDANTFRLSRKFKWISQTNLDELQKLDIGRYKGEKYKGETIPTLNEILKTVPINKKILIEIKSDKTIVPYLKDVLHKSSLAINQIEIISFNLNILIEIRKQIPDLSVLWILNLDYYWYGKIFRTSIKKIIAKAKRHELQGLDLWAGHILNAKMIQTVKSAGLIVYVWTINEPLKAKLLFEMNVDGITTDRAGWMKNQLNTIDSNK